MKQFADHGARIVTATDKQARLPNTRGAPAGAVSAGAEKSVGLFPYIFVEALQGNEQSAAILLWIFEEFEARVENDLAPARCSGAPLAGSGAAAPPGGAGAGPREELNSIQGVKGMKPITFPVIRTCEFCGKIDQTIPCGPEGESICLSCALKNEKTSLKQINRLLREQEESKEDEHA